jgi:hypothetical protein
MLHFGKNSLCADLGNPEQVQCSIHTGEAWVPSIAGGNSMQFCITLLTLFILLCKTAFF